jgi:hypothetical protein
VQLSLEVVDIALGDTQIILSVLQSVASVIEVVSLEVMAMISPHQLIVQLVDARLKAGVLLKKLSVALLNVLDGAILDLHLAGVLLQAEAQLRARRCDLLKHGAHVLECPHGPCSAPARIDSMDGHGMRESPCSQSGATCPRARWKNWGGATRHNGTIHRL